MNDVQLVIFDSDGVLVDSEKIALDVLGAMARSRGAAIGDAEALKIFRGLKIADCVVEIERRAGKPVEEDFIEAVRTATAEAFEKGLRATRGIHDALEAITTLSCVASNGPMKKLRQTLGLTGLLARFEGRIFSAYEVGSWKPDPGLFLHAARTLGVRPDRCLVVEDSISGVRAARAAGMRVLGFADGDQEAAEDLSAGGAVVYHHMSELPGLVARYSDC